MTSSFAAMRSTNSTSKLAFLWGLFVCCASLNVTVLPHIHWYLTVLLLGPLMLQMVRVQEISSVLPKLAAPALLVLAFATASFGSDEPVLSMVHGAKIAVLLLPVYALFVANPGFARSAFHGAVTAVVLNVLLVGLHSASVLNWAWSRTHGRWDTMLADRTTLSLLGCFAVVYAVSRGLATNRLKIFSLVLACCSVVLVLLGGSRTYMLALPLGILYGLVAAWWTSSGTPVLGRAVKLVAGVCFAGCFSWAGYTLSSSDGESLISVPDRVLAMLDFSQGGSIDAYLETQDAARVHLMEVAWAKIQADPVRGSGFHSMYLVGASEAPIHNAYLQSWADLGLLGLLSYSALTFGWVLHLGKAIETVSRMQDPEMRALHASSIWGLGLFIVTGLRGPLVVEPSHWFFFIVPSALYCQVLQEAPVAQNRSHYQRSRDGRRRDDSLEAPVEHRWAAV